MRGFDFLGYGRYTRSITTLFSVDAVTIEATARLTNIRFTADLQDVSSQAYKNLTESILAEVSVCFMKKQKTK